MAGNEREIRKISALRSHSGGRVLSLSLNCGKGSHGEARFGHYRTTVALGEIPTGTLASMLKDLHIDRREF